MADFLVQIKDSDTIEIKEKDLDSLDMVKNNDGSFHVLYNNKSYNISILTHSCDNKQYTLSINDKEIELNIKDSLDQMLDKMGFFSNKKLGSGKIKSPMPGLVLKINVNEGDEVLKGDTLLTLEAMKMENLIKSPTNGTVKTIEIKEGSVVTKNQVLLEIE